MKRLQVFLLSVLVLICCTWLTASAETIMVEYVDANGVLQEAVEATIIDSNTRTLNDGWHVITDEVTINARIKTNGNVNLILVDGCKLDTKGITVDRYSSLTIWGQSAGTGELTASGTQGVGSYVSGIGGDTSSYANGRITINGGIITATAGSWSAGIGSAYNGNAANITINGGFVTATGHHGGAGIGGGGADNYGRGGNASNITITGGTVIANGEATANSAYHSGAGIGSGACGVYENGNTAENITITGGNITATGGYGAAGIGGGYGSAGRNITITGGIVNATGRYGAAGIGGGATDDSKSPAKFGNGSAIRIGGDAKVLATGSGDGAGIGGGYAGTGSDISISGNAYVEAIGGDNGYGIGAGNARKTSGIVFSGGTTIATAGNADLRAIGAVPTFIDFPHFTYGNALGNTPTDIIVEQTDNANEKWAWPWVKIQPTAFELALEPNNPTVILDGTNTGAIAFTLGYMVNGELQPLPSSAAPVWSLSGKQNTATTISQNGNLNIAADERAATLTVIVALNGTEYTTKVTIQQPTCTVTFDSDGGSTVASQTVNRYASAHAPTDPTRTGYTFDGWYNGAQKWDFGNEVINNLTLTAHWTEIPQTGDNTYTIYFDANGGNCDQEYAKTNEDGTLASLPTADRTGFGFDGWYTSLEGGNLITQETIFTEDMTVYAHWIEMPQTGDNTPLELWGLLALLSLCSIILSCRNKGLNRVC